MRKIISIFVILFLIGFESSVFGAGKTEQEGPVTIYGLVNDGYARIWQEQLVPKFKEMYPNIDVIIDGVPYGEQLTKQMLELTSNVPKYDFFAQDDPWIPQMASTGLLVDLKKDLADITDATYDWDDILPGPAAAGIWEGKVYGVPIRSNLLLMFYNKTLFKAAGLEEPGDGYSWSDLMNDLPKLCRDTDGDGEDDVWGISTYFHRDSLTPTIWQAIMCSNGGKLLDENFKPAFNNKIGIDALQYHIDLSNYGPPGAKNHGFTDSLEAFRQGKVAVLFNWGSIYYGVAINPDTTTLKEGEVGIAPLPGGTFTNASSHRGIWTASVLKKSEHVEEAWQFIQWVTSKEGEKWASANLSQFPARESTLKSEPSKPWLTDVFDAIYKGYDAIGKGSMWRPRLPDSDGVQRILALHHNKAMTGEVTPAQALEDAEDEILKLLKDKNYF